MTAGLEIEGVTWRPAAGKAPVLDDVSLRVPERSLTVLIGPSGCGKSSLSYAVAGFVKPEAGSIRIDGQPVTGPGPDRLMVFQESALWPWMTVRENVTFGPQTRGEMSRAEADHAAGKLLARFGLAAFADKYPGQLSGGMMRRVDIAQALINRPKLLILDEPFRGLDVMTRELMQEYYLGVFEETRTTTLFVTSEVEEAVFLADRVLVLGNGGRVRESVAIDLERPRRQTVTATAAFQRLRAQLLAALDRATGHPIETADNGLSSVAAAQLMENREKL